MRNVSAIHYEVFRRYNPQRITIRCAVYRAIVTDTFLIETDTMPGVSRYTMKCITIHGHSYRDTLVTVIDTLLNVSVTVTSVSSDTLKKCIPRTRNGRTQ